ncbi:MAG TPA: hypothetical protein PLX15_05335 [Candidatus Woesearchaeota archaeon]|nr:hypothetical protein [Candidatus Woesearchaeota archaeon]
MKLNNNVLFYLVLALCLTNILLGFYLSGFQKPALVRSPSALAVSGNIGMCVIGSPETKYYFSKPLRAEIWRSGFTGIQEVELINALAQGGHTFTFRMTFVDKYGGPGSREFGNFTGNTSAPMVFDLNISGIPDGNCIYELNYYSSVDDDCSWISTIQYLTIDNEPIAPTWETFKNENSTNLSQYNTPPDYWTKIPNVHLYHPLYGSIDFSKSNFPMNFDSVNLDEAFVFGQGTLNFSQTKFRCATAPEYPYMDVIFRNISLIDPTLLRDHRDCIADGSCQELGYDEEEGIYSVLIPPYGYFEVVENAEAVLEIWLTNQSDNTTYNSNSTFYVHKENNTFYFYSNLSYSHYPLFGDDIYCNYSIIDITNNPNNFSAAPIITTGNFTYNNTTQLYGFSHEFNTKGNFLWSTFCSVEDIGLGNVSKNLLFQISSYPALLDVWSDLDPPGGSQSLYARDPIYIYADYTDKLTGDPINSNITYCNISLNNLSLGRWTVEFDNITAQMTYNETSGLYQYESHILFPGTYTYSVFCDDYPLHENLSQTKNMTIPNRLPLLYRNISNYSVRQGYTTPLFNLYGFFIDFDGELLNFSTTYNPYLGISISPLGMVRVSASGNFTGNTTVTFIARDHTMIPIPSNEITITVIATQSTSSGGSDNPRTSSGDTLFCIEKWNCSEWSECFPDNIQYRTCVDQNNCGTLSEKPIVEQSCLYIGTCFDGIQNQGETGIDCGGPCPVCPTCFDGIRNQGETGIDCGGPCAPCASCFDGIQNQGETGIDCGGPCPPCGVLEAPLVIKTPISDYLSEITVFSTLLLSLIFIMLNYYKEIGSFFKKLIWSIFRFAKSYSFEDVEITDIEKYIRDNLERIDYSTGKVKNKELLSQIVSLYRLFIKYLFNLEFEFTYEELKLILSSSNISVASSAIYLGYFKDISEAVYSGKEIGSSEIKRYIKLFEKMIIINRELIAKADLLHEEEQIINKLNLFPWRKKFLNARLRMKIEMHITKHLSYAKGFLIDKDLIRTAEEYNLIRNLILLLPSKHRKKYFERLKDIKSRVEELKKSIQSKANP